MFTHIFVVLVSLYVGWSLLYPRTLKKIEKAWNHNDILAYVTWVTKDQGWDWEHKSKSSNKYLEKKTIPMSVFIVILHVV